MGVYIIAIDGVGLVADTLSERALGCNSLWSSAARLEQATGRVGLVAGPHYYHHDCCFLFIIEITSLVISLAIFLAIK